MNLVIKKSIFLIICTLMFSILYIATPNYWLIISNCLILTVFGFSLRKFLLTDQRRYIVLALFFTLAVLPSLPYTTLYGKVLNQLIKLNINSIIINNCITILLCGIVLSIAFFIIWWIMTGTEKKLDIITQEIKPIKISDIFKYSFYPLVGFTLEFIKNYPAKLTPDSYDQLRQIYGQELYNNVHAIGHTLYCALLMKIMNTPAIVIVVQLVLMSLVVGFALAYFRAKEYPNRLLIIVSIFFGTFPPNKDIITYFWKDIPYSIAILFMTILLIIYIDKNKDIKTSFLIFGGIALTGIQVFRHNGIIVYIFVLIAILVLYKKYRTTKYLLPIILSIVLIFAIRFIAFNIINTQPNYYGTKYAIFAKSVVSVIAKGGNINTQQIEEIAEIVPLDIIHEKYAWDNGGGLVWIFGTPKYPNYIYHEAILKNHKTILKLFIELYPKNIVLMTWDLLGSASLTWKLKIDYLDKNMPYMLLLVILTAVLIKKNKKEAIISFVPVFTNIISIAISNTTYEPRYIYPTIAVFPFLLLYLLPPTNIDIKKEESGTE